MDNIEDFINTINDTCGEGEQIEIIVKLLGNLLEWIDLNHNDDIEEETSKKLHKIKDDLLEIQEKFTNAKPKKIRIVYKKVNEDAKVMEIENTLEAKQDLVGGLIEVVPYLNDDILLVCNEEGKLMNLKPNVLFDLDYIAGDFFVIGDDYENADFKSLTDAQCEEIIKDLNSRAMKYNEEGKNDD